MGVRDIAIFIISHEQTQITRNLQFSSFYFGLVALEGSTFYQNCYSIINTGGLMDKVSASQPRDRIVGSKPTRVTTMIPHMTPVLIGVI